MEKRNFKKLLFYYILNLIFVGVPIFLFLDVYKMDSDTLFGALFTIGIICARFSRFDYLEEKFDELKRKVDGKY